MGQRICGWADGSGMDVTTGGFASQKMIDLNLKLQLPPPWKGQLFETDKIGPVNFLVGPNGSGKSQLGREGQLLLGSLSGDWGVEARWKHRAKRERQVTIRHDIVQLVENAARRGSFTRH